MKVIRVHRPQDVPIQPEGLPSDHQDHLQGLPLLYLVKMLAGQMAGATSSPLRTMMPLPLRYQTYRVSEPTLTPSTSSGSPPLLVSSAHRPRWQFVVDDHRRRCLRFRLIFGRCDWVGHHSGAPPTAESETGAPPLLERV